MRLNEETKARLRLYKVMGYEIYAYFMFAAPATSAQRAINHFLEGEKRRNKAPFPDLGSILNRSTNEATFDGARGSFNYWALYNNEGPAPKLVDQGFSTRHEATIRRRFQSRHARLTESDIAALKKSNESNELC